MTLVTPGGPVTRWAAKACKVVSLGPSRASQALVDVNRSDQAHDKAQRLKGVTDKVAVQILGGEAVPAGTKSLQRGNGTFAMIAIAGLVLIYAMNK